MELAIRYDRKAVSQSDRDGMHNFARCLESGKGIGQNFIRRAKYYRRSADLKNTAAENSFGICLEREIGVQSNAALAAHYYQQSALEGHPGAARSSSDGSAGHQDQWGGKMLLVGRRMIVVLHPQYVVGMRALLTECLTLYELSSCSSI
jgi:TPR repeat protein